MYVQDLVYKKPKAQGLLISCGDYWRLSRHMLSPTFSMYKMKMVSPVLQS